jgi:hypothetical protein
MANKQPYQLTAATLALTDVFPTQVFNGATEVGKSTIQDVKDLFNLNYTTYAARVTQSGSSNPTAVEAANTTGATATWERASAGYSTLTFDTAILTAGKTIIQINGVGSGGYTDPKLFSYQQASTTLINFGAFRASDQTAEDGWVMDIIIYIFE